MKILPVYLTKRTTLEMPIGIFNCERIMLNKLICPKEVAENVQSCIVYFNGTPVRYTRKPNSKKAVFFVDGIPDNVKSFHLIAPCYVRLMLDFPVQDNNGLSGLGAKFLLHLSLEVGRVLRNVG